MPQEELARRVGVSKGTISRYESGTRDPSFSMVERIAGALGVSLAKFFGQRMRKAS